MFDFGFGWFILGFGVLGGGGCNIDIWVFWVWILGGLWVFVVGWVWVVLFGRCLVGCVSFVNWFVYGLVGVFLVVIWVVVWWWVGFGFLGFGASCLFRL